MTFVERHSFPILNFIIHCTFHFMYLITICQFPTINMLFLSLCTYLSVYPLPLVKILSFIHFNTVNMVSSLYLSFMCLILRYSQYAPFTQSTWFLIFYVL